jgi:hypothetical protein
LHDVHDRSRAQNCPEMTMNNDHLRCVVSAASTTEEQALLHSLASCLHNFVKHVPPLHAGGLVVRPRTGRSHNLHKQADCRAARQRQALCASRSQYPKRRSRCGSACARSAGGKRAGGGIGGTWTGAVESTEAAGHRQLCSEAAAAPEQ